MSGGHNTDLRHGGRRFHVQTEDRGPGVARIETRVYLAGEILHALQASYDDLVGHPGWLELRRERMACQHQRVLEDLRSGVLPWEGPPPFGARPLGEAVMDALAQELARDRVELVLTQPLAPRPGARFTVALRAQLRHLGWPVPGASIAVAWVGLEGTHALVAGRTGEGGAFVGTAELPEAPSDLGHLRLESVSQGLEARLEVPVLPAVRE